MCAATRGRVASGSSKARRLQHNKARASFMAQMRVGRTSWVQVVGRSVARATHRDTSGTLYRSSEQAARTRRWPAFWMVSECDHAITRTQHNRSKSRFYICNHPVQPPRMQRAMACAAHRQQRMHACLTETSAVSCVTEKRPSKSPSSPKAGHGSRNGRRFMGL
jgi:hypothetical protein